MAGVKTGHALWDGNHGGERGTPLVLIRCGACGQRAGTIEDRDGAVKVVVEGRRYEHLGRVQCGTHGTFPTESLDWQLLWPLIEKARDAGKARTFKARPERV